MGARPVAKRSGCFGRRWRHLMAPQANQPGVAVVVGVGPGLGAALVRRFARDGHTAAGHAIGGYPVAMIARSREFMDGLAAEVEAAGGGALAGTRERRDA